MNKVLEIKNLHAGIENKQILKGVNLTIKTGEVHAIMGPNGTGKSTLSSIVMGQPKYHVTEGDILIDGESILPLAVDERARKGIFLAYQYPAEVSGVTNSDFIRTAMKSVTGKDTSLFKFIKDYDKAFDAFSTSQILNCNVKRYLLNDEEAKEFVLTDYYNKL